MSLKLNSSGGGSVTLSEPVTANNYTLTLPAQNSTLATVDGTNTTFTSITDSGNLTFTGTGNRIIGDFSGSGFTRLGFISSVTGATSPTIIANATYASGGAAAALTFYNQNDANNGTFGQFLAATTEVRLSAGAYGTGTYLPMTFYTGASERMRIDTSGNVGIGTSSPDVKLRITGANVAYKGQMVIDSTDYAQITAYNGSTQYGQILWGTTSGGAASVGMTLGTTTANPIIFNTNNTERMRIDSSGNVGIGTTNTLANALLNVGQGIVARNVSTETPYLQTYNGNAGSNLKIWRIGGASNGTMTFETVNDAYSAATTRMAIDSSGNVGIGTSSPSTFSGQLTVAGGSVAGLQTYTPGNLSGIGAGTFKAYQNSSDSYKRYLDIVAFGDGVGSTGSNIRFLTQPSTGTSSIEVARISSSGVVTMPYQIAFSAYFTNASYSTVGVIPLNSTHVNIGSAYNTSTYRFTAPVAGNYLFTYGSGAVSCTYADFSLQKNGGALSNTLFGNNCGGTGYPCDGRSIVLPLAAGDYMTVYYSGSSPANAVIRQNYTVFSGHLIG